MTPYADPFYFIILGIALIPLIICQCFGKKAMWYQVLFTVAFLGLSFGGKKWHQGLALLFFGIWQLFLAKGYAWYRQTKKKNSFVVFVMVLLGAIFPLFTDKLIPHSMLAFLGISYLTFRSVNVIMELRDNLIKKLPVKDFLYFLYFFPTISMGPIDRFRRFQKELSAPVVKNYGKYLEKGIFALFLGFLYKFIISHLLQTIAVSETELNFLNNHDFLSLLGYMYAYGFNLFFDFAGGSLFAIGVSYLMGYEIPKNFHLPFISKNIKDFWNRWHMSLSFWFRDFVYMRLVYWIMKNKYLKNTVIISNLSYFVLFLLMGLWHGFTWYYIAYGLFHALLMCLTDAWIRFKRKHKTMIFHGKIIDGFCIVLTTHAILFSFLIFSGIFDKLLH